MCAKKKNTQITRATRFGSGSPLTSRQKKYEELLFNPLPIGSIGLLLYDAPKGSTRSVACSGLAINKLSELS